jgi:hypothetical protein
MSTSVNLQGHALELAQRMVDEGLCATLEEAVARSLAIAHLHDTAPDWDAQPAGAKVNSQVADEIQDRADSGELGENAPKLWRHVRAEVQLLAARQAR